MDYCGPHGIPHSAFLGWSDSDQQKAIWWMARSDQRCSGCGTHPDDWNEDLGGHPDAYHPEERVCPGCQRRSIAQDQLDKARTAGESKHGVRVVLIPTFSH
jgi:hypothetical protein